MTIETNVLLTVAKWTVSAVAGFFVIRHGYLFTKKKIKEWGQDMFTSELTKQIGETNKAITSLESSFRKTSEIMLADNQNILRNQRLSDAKQRGLMNLIKECAFETDAQGDWKFANGNLCEFVGKDEDDLHEKQWISLIVPRDRMRVMQEFYESVNQKRSASIECDIYKSGRIVVPVNIQTRKMQCTDGIYFGVLGIITEKEKK